MTQVLVWIALSSHSAGRSAPAVYHTSASCYQRQGMQPRIPTLVSAAQAAGLQPCHYCK